MLNPIIGFFLRNGVVVFALIAAVIVAGVAVMPFDTPFDEAGFRDRVPVDALPDITENQVIVWSDWPGRSPRDVEDQVTYPLATALQGIPRVHDVRGISGFGMSRIYVVFEDGVDFYWARSRVLEKLATVTGLPEDVMPALGPDATALGQIFWYTVDGAGVTLDELRAVQDFEVRYALQAVPGVAEVASVGGQVRTYSVELDPERLRAYDVTVPEIVAAIRGSNLDIGATTLNTDDGGSEYILRGRGFLRSLDELAATAVLKRGDDVPIRLGDVATVQFAPAFRRGALADETQERVGGVVAMRFGANPKEVIDGVKEAIDGLNVSLAARGITINTFYDRTQLIEETLGTLSTALLQQILVTVVVVLIFLLHVRTSLIVAATLPLAMLVSFIAMKVFGIDSNIMSLAGIAIAIGVMVDTAVIMTENSYAALLEDGGRRNPIEPVYEASTEVASAILTAITTTVISFLPVFLLTDQEGKLFQPLAWTKTFCMVAAVVIAIILVPLLCRLFLHSRVRYESWQRVQRILWHVGLVSLGLLVGYVTWQLGGLVWGLIAAVVAYLLAWRASRERLTPIEKNPVSRGIYRVYEPTLRLVLRHKLKFLAVPLLIVLAGLTVYVGAATMLYPLKAGLHAVGVDPERVRPIAALQDAFPGIGEEFMPPLDEGSLLYMPSLLPQASLQETLDAIVRQNQAMRSVPEVAQVMGKLGRADSALDPAPVGMIETVVNLKPRSEWRSGYSVDDIVHDLRVATEQVGVQPSWLQPIETRIVMLQAGIRAQVALKVFGTDLDALQRFVQAAESFLRAVPGATDVSAQRLGGKPYLEIDLQSEAARERMAYHGVRVVDAQRVITAALGDMAITTTVEGRQRFAVRTRLAPDFRDSIEAVGALLVPATLDGRKTQVPLRLLAEIETRLGPAMILTENGFLYSYVNFNTSGRDVVSVVNDARAAIAGAVADGRLAVPAEVTRWTFAGQYESQVRAANRLALLVPGVLFIILFLLYLHFRDTGLTLLVFAGIPIAFAGGFLFVWAWPGVEQAIFAVDHAVLGGTYPVPRGDPVYLTVAVWVGMIALFGIAIDDGVLIGTYLKQSMRRNQPRTVAELHEAVLEAGRRRIRPAMMTTVTTLIALMPVLWATGRGSDVAKPMALPVVGGMIVAATTWFMVPVVFAWFEERRLRRDDAKKGDAA